MKLKLGWFGLLLANTLWRLVFWWKQRTGWLKLGDGFQVTGTITKVDKNVVGIFNDGDVTFNVQVDPGQEWMITGFAGRLTSEDDAPPPAIHCEIPPWTRNKFLIAIDMLEVGKRVRVKGAWGFDGVHTGKPEWLEVLYALVRHMPNVEQGWFELHPVTEIEFLP